MSEKQILMSVLLTCYGGPPAIASIRGLPARQVFRAFILAVLCFPAGFWYAFRAIDEKLKAARERDDAARKEKEELAQREQVVKQRHHAEQTAVRQRLTELEAAVNSSVQLLPKELAHAEAALEQAENEFRDHALAPFWDAIERAVTHLATFDDGVGSIALASKHIVEAVKTLDGEPPRVYLREHRLPASTRAIERMRVVVRQAQTDFQFATIYEQRRTNGILVAGFANLGTAINDMGARIQRSLGELEQSLGSALASLSETQAEHMRELVSGMETMRDQLASDAQSQREHAHVESEARRKHEYKSEKMLDNIQRRKRPFVEKYRDGQY